MSNGGASRSGYWTAAVLGKIEDSTLSWSPRKRFSKRVFCLSGTSGGGLGVACYFSMLQAHDSSKAGYTNALHEYLRKDYFTPSFTRLLGPDFFYYDLFCSRQRTGLPSWRTAEQALRLARAAARPAPARPGGGGTDRAGAADERQGQVPPGPGDAVHQGRPGTSVVRAGRRAQRRAASRDAGTVADLCCGIGGNLAALAARSRVLAVDRDLTSLEFARHNAAVSARRARCWPSAPTSASSWPPARTRPASGSARCSSTRPGGRPGGGCGPG